MYPENTTVNGDIVKRYVLTFKATHEPPKIENKKLFKMKKLVIIPALYLIIKYSLLNI